jgi:nitrate/TMAO reductase-like tetraheme cytochrome c subunit
MNLDPTRLLAYVALASAAGAAAILVIYLVARPALSRRMKLWLFAGLGPLPITAALVGNVSNYNVTKERRFCASCHVMAPYADDAEDPKSSTLASIHSKNPYFGGESCYVCHADYGMFGTVMTKVGGMRHVWHYYTEDWDAPDHPPLKLYQPYSNTTCMQCHPSDRARQPLEHQVHGRPVREGQVACTAAGCHGRSHPPAEAQ